MYRSARHLTTVTVVDVRALDAVIVIADVGVVNVVFPFPLPLLVLVRPPVPVLPLVAALGGVGVECGGLHQRLHRHRPQ